MAFYFIVMQIAATAWRAMFTVTDVNDPAYLARQKFDIFMAVSSVFIFIIAYAFLYYKNEKERKIFLAGAKEKHVWKEDLIFHLKNYGRNEIITYAAFSLFTYLIYQFIYVNSAIAVIILSFNYSQFVLYMALPFPILGFLLGVMMFAVLYPLVIIIVHKKWYKVYYFKKA